MKNMLKKWIALTLCVLMLLSSVGCSYVILGCAALSCASCAKDNPVHEQIGEAVKEEIKEEIQENLPQIGTLFTTPEPDSSDPEANAAGTSENKQKSSGTEAANQAFLALDHEIFIWYITSDVVTMDQYCYDPVNFGIDETTVPVTLGSFTLESQNEWIAECRNWLSRLQKLDYANLSEQNQFAYDNIVRYFENEIAFDGLFYYYEPLDEYVGLQSNLPLTFGLYEFRDVKDVENYLALMADVPRYFEEVLAFEKERANLGIFMTESMLDVVLSDLDSVANSKETSYLYATFREALEPVDWLTDQQKETYYAKNDELVRGAFTDAYAALRDGMEALRPYCREMTGAKNMDAAALEYFELMLRSQSANNMSVDEAISFLESTLMDLYETLIAAYRKSSQKEDITFSTGSIEGDERYLKTLITQIVPPIPDITVKYKEIPPELQESFSPAAYLIPAIDHYRENTILINPKSTQPADIFTIAHEGYPGHMFQYTYQYDLGTIPMFQMTIEPIGYAEGWSTSAEYSVAKRADMFGTADAEVQVLNDHMINTIVEICTLMVNGKGASKADIKKYLQQWSLDDAADEVFELAVNMPVYYFKYVMGFCQQFALTEDCRDIYSFDDRDFYREYLSWGPAYFDLLRPKMIAWAERNASR